LLATNQIVLANIGTRKVLAGSKWLPRMTTREQPSFSLLSGLAGMRDNPVTPASPCFWGLAKSRDKTWTRSRLFRHTPEVVSNSAKRCQKSDEPLLRLKERAMEHFSAQGSVAMFASTHGLPRSTVSGWKKRWDSDRAPTKQGRPKLLATYNESKVLEILMRERRLLGWRDVQQLIRAQSGEKVSRRGVLRLLQRWEISADNDHTGEAPGLQQSTWQQPQATRHGTSVAPRTAVLWIFYSGRGMEKFMFTGSCRPVDIVLVRAALTEHGGKRRLVWSGPAREELKRLES